MIQQETKVYLSFDKLHSITTASACMTHLYTKYELSLSIIPESIKTALIFPSNNPHLNSCHF